MAPRRPFAGDPWLPPQAVSRGRVNGLARTAFHFDSVEGAGAVAGARLHVSFDDGVTWRPVEAGGHRKLAGEGHHPRRGVDFVSLRVTAWDDAGNEITQRVVRAFSVR